MESIPGDDTRERRGDKWSIDRRVPVVTALMLALNVGGTVWYASKLDSRVTHLEESAMNLQSSFHEQSEKNGSASERIAKIEITMGYMGKQLDNISDKLDKRFVK